MYMQCDCIHYILGIIKTTATSSNSLQNYALTESEVVLFNFKYLFYRITCLRVCFSTEIKNDDGSLGTTLYCGRMDMHFKINLIVTILHYDSLCAIL